MNGLGYTSLGGNSFASPSDGNTGSDFARVVDIILDSFHPEFDNYGKSQSIYGVFYRSLSESIVEEEEGPLRFAYCQRKTFTRVPLKGEVVRLVQESTEERENSKQGTKAYWSHIIPIWNHPHHNVYPDTIQSGESENDFGEYFEELDKIAPLQGFPGDDIIEGRFGQTIRFNGTKYDSNTITDDSNNGSPTILISNGQKEPPNSVDNVVEDINEDPNSLYFVSDHSVPLEQAHEKRDGFDQEPEKADTFKGNQVVLNGGRLYFNAKEEGAFISAKESIGFNAKVIGIDSDDYIGLDSKKIYLGTTAFDEEEPALKGQTSTDWLDDLTSLLEGLAKTMATTPPAPPTYIAALVKEGAKLQVQLPKLKSVLKQLHSKKVFIDNK